jgi:EpsI family protein
VIRRSAVVTALLVAVWVVSLRLVAPVPVRDVGALSQFPETVGGWRGQDAPLEPDVVRSTGVDDYLNRYYRAGGVAVGLFVAYYRSQQPGRAFHSPLNCLPGNGWEPIEKERIALSPDSHSVSSPTINKVLIEKGVDRQLVLYWYQTPTRVTASEYLSKVFLVRDALQTGRTDVAMVRITAPIDPQDPAAQAVALGHAVPFAERVLPLLARGLFFQS